MQKYALLSVSDKNGIVEFGKKLSDNDYKIIATGNTSRLLKESGIETEEISSLTGFPEIFDGRVKTLHPKIFGGILLRRDNESDKKQAEDNNIFPIDVVCVNLYPFVKTIRNKDVSLDDAIENIDIGGPSLIRAAAKNHKYVSVLTKPEQYDEFMENINDISEDFRKRLAVEAFSHTANYDTHISNYFEQKFELPQSYVRINHPLKKQLRYGENPHQEAEIYGDFYTYFEVLHGKELSYNNVLDLVSAVELSEELGDNSCTIIKHNNPAGAAVGDDPFNAYEKALKCDPVSSFGGIISINGKVDAKLAEKLNEIFLEVITALDYTDEAMEILSKKKQRRLLKQLKKITSDERVFKKIPGGVILQDADNFLYDENELKIITDKEPTDEELEDLKFAWKIAKHTKSNAIVFVKDQATLGVGAGQMSRIDSVKIADMKAKEHGLNLKGSVVASDAFFPFADGLLEIINCGATSVIQPGGSVRDQEVIDAANQNKISMVFTSVRHFKH